MSKHGNGFRGVGTKRGRPRKPETAKRPRTYGNDEWNRLGNRSTDPELERWSGLSDEERAAVEIAFYGYRLPPVVGGGALAGRRSSHRNATSKGDT